MCGISFFFVHFFFEKYCTVHTVHTVFTVYVQQCTLSVHTHCIINNGSQKCYFLLFFILKIYAVSCHITDKH